MNNTGCTYKKTTTKNDLLTQVDDKYMYSMENKDNKVHGWISSDQRVGFWMVTPSDEFRVCGPVKQDLTSHVGPTVLSVSTSSLDKNLILYFHYEC